MNTIDLIQVTATLIGIVGGLFGLYKYFTDKRNSELREWQKVIIHRIMRKSELVEHTFDSLLSAYRLEAQAFQDFDLPKKEITEYTLHRILIELIASNVIKQRLHNSYKLSLVIDQFSPQELVRQLNKEIVRFIGSNPYFYTIDEVLKEIAPKVGMADQIPVLHNELMMAIQNKMFVLDEKGRIAFPQHAKPS